jgi:GcrA cell cycle regulator
MPQSDDVRILHDLNPPAPDDRPKASRFDWSAARVALLQQRWSEGVSAASIAQELGEGISRSAVLGKIHRLKLVQPEFKRQHPRKEKAALKRERRPRPQLPRVRVASALMAAFQALGLGAGHPEGDIGSLHQHANKAFGPTRAFMDLDATTCRWPIGDPDQPDFVFCGAAPFKRYPYCLSHCLIAYRPDAMDVDRPASQAPPRALAEPRPDQSRRRAA